MSSQRLVRLSSLLALVLFVPFASVRAQDDPFGPSTVPTRTFANAPGVTVRVRAFDPVASGADAPGRRHVVSSRVGHGVLAERGLVVTTTSVVGASTFVLVQLPGEAAMRVAYVVHTDAQNALVVLALPSARSVTTRSLERFAPSRVDAPLEAYAFASEEASSATARPVTLRPPDSGGHRRVVGVDTPGALVVAEDDTLRGLVEADPDGQFTLIPIAAVHALVDRIRANVDGVRGAGGPAEELARTAALALDVVSPETSDDAIRAVLEPVADAARRAIAARTDLTGLSSDAAIIIAAACASLADLAEGAGDSARETALRRAARGFAADALSRDPGLASRSALVVTLASEEPHLRDVSTGTTDDASAAGTEPEGEDPAARAPDADRPRPALFTGSYAPRFFVLSLGMPFAPSSNVHIGGAVLDVSSLWLVPKGDRDATRRFGAALGPTVSLGANGGQATGRVGVELGFLARFGRKPGLFLSAGWVPSVYFGEGEAVVTATALRARLGVSIGRFGVALGYDLASPNGVYAYHAVQVAFVRER